jgi:hypothetical protein
LRLRERKETFEGDDIVALYDSIESIVKPDNSVRRFVL